MAIGRPRTGASGTPAESAIPALARALSQVLASDVDGLETMLVTSDASGVARQVVHRGTVRTDAGGATVTLTLPRRVWPQPEGVEPPRYQIVQRSDLPEAAAAAAVPGMPSLAEAPTTGVIIDATGLGLRPGLWPVVLVQGTDRAVHQPAQADELMARQSGVTGYAASVEDARRDMFRVGPNPLVLQATSANGTNVSVSASDAARILDADPRGDLRFNCKVMLVTG